MAKHTIGLVLFLILHSSSVCGQTNHALIIAISDYPVYSGWEELHATNDVRILLPFLSKHHFEKQHIKVLTNKDATYRNINRAMQELAAKVTAGDGMYFHFSGHGQQMMDDNGDEEDGLDEALIPYDAGFWYEPGKYEGKNHLCDDELGVWIDHVRKKAGSNGNVMVVLDACHSGTANRKGEQEEYLRGTGAIFAPDGYVPREGGNTNLSLKLKPVKGYAPVAVFSACLSSENNYEYFDANNKSHFGFLTYAFIATAQGIRTSITVGDFMEKLKVCMQRMKPRSRKQTPYMECSSGNILFKIGR